MTYAPPDDPAKLGYIAGIIDGEGTITGRHRERKLSCHWHVTVIMCDRATIEWLASFGGKFDELPLRTDKRSGAQCKPQFSWRLTSIGNVRALLRAISPYMITKRDAAEYVVREIDRRWDDNGEPRA